jgi:hypothetical protein
MYPVPLKSQETKNGRQKEIECAEELDIHSGSDGGSS